ncbi:MAG: leucine-rich repeat protein, partial [Clostridia bacterium]|nr:leucine-rich repeat protein [Clostridia bacterium]
SDRELKAIAVSATVEEGNGYVFEDDYSNFGTMIDVSAPGSRVKSAWIAGNDGPCDDYVQKSGTSMASPQVAGAIALLYLDPSLDEGFKATDIENALYDNALDMGAKGKDKYYGHGMVNLKYFEIADKNNALEIYKDGILIDKDYGDEDFADAVKIEVSCSPEFKIFYTADSSIPSPTNGTEYTGAIFLEKPTTINFMGFKIVDGEIVEKTVLRNIEYKPKFEINEDGWIVKYNGKENHIEIPEYIGGVKITGICEKAFYLSEVQRVHMPYIETIGTQAFRGCSSLVYIEAPQLEKIDLHAFYGCTKLNTFLLGENLKDVAGGAFYSTGITSFKMHPNNKNLYTDGKGIYSKSELLTVVPNSSGLDYEIKGEIEIDGKKHRITTIKEDAFFSQVIHSLTIPETITKIEDYAFLTVIMKIMYYNANAEVAYHSLYSLRTDLFVIGESVSMLPDYLVDYSYISNIEIRSFATEFMPYSLYGGAGAYNNLFFNFDDEIDASYVKSIASLFHGGFASIRNNIIAKSPLPVAEATGLSEFEHMATIGEYYIYGRQPLFNAGKTITATANEGGTLTPLGIQYYINGTSATYHIMPEDGYKVESIIVDGNALTKEEIYDAIANGYTFENIYDNHTIDVKFVELAGKIIGKTLDIQNEMAMVFYVDLDYASTINATMIFSKPIYADGNGDIVREDVTTVADYELATINNQIVLKFVYRNINAKEYGVDVTARVLVDGEVVCTTTFSVKEYAYSQLERSKNPKLNTLLVDMLNYGASAQIYFDYNTNALVNADLTEEQKAYATKEVSEAVSYARVLANDRGKSIIDIKGATLSLENKIKIIVVVEINCNLEDFGVVVSYKTLDGYPITKEISGS